MLTLPSCLIYYKLLIYSQDLSILSLLILSENTELIEKKYYFTSEKWPVGTEYNLLFDKLKDFPSPVGAARVSPPQKGEIGGAANHNDPPAENHSRLLARHYGAADSLSLANL